MQRETRIVVPAASHEAIAPDAFGLVLSRRHGPDRVRNRGGRNLRFDHAASPWYSWMSPPSRSRRRTSRGLTGTKTSAPDFQGPAICPGGRDSRSGPAQDVVVDPARSPTGCGVGWRGRIRPFDLLIQSQLPESGLASRVLSVGLGRRRPPNRGESGAHPKMSQKPIPKTERVCCPMWASPIVDDLESRTRDRRTSPSPRTRPAVG